MPAGANDDLCLNLANGTQLVVPNSLKSITTYVVLEQERWFEKEWGFVAYLLQPGMVALDIGANLGIFSMTMARAVGPTGRIFAYEPTSDTRGRLERSKAINGADNLVIVGSALSDTEREGRIVFGASSELNRLGEAGDSGEAVHLTSLDLEAARLGWSGIDFIKMDAEGEELRIVAGGKSVFEAGSPVVMFEIKSETGYEPATAAAFQALGYGLYRLLPDEKHLVPFIEAELDSFELNLFALKSDRAAELAGRGLLSETSDGSFAAGDFRAFARGKVFSGVFPELLDAAAPEALDAYAAWRDETRPIAERYAALRASHAMLTATAGAPSVARTLSLARVASDLGLRMEATNTMRASLQMLDGGAKPQEPFLPPTLRHEGLGESQKVWLYSGCIEAFELGSKHSSFYGPVLSQLDWLSRNKLNSSALERRRALSGLIRGQAISLRRALDVAAPDHLNAEAWVKLIG